MLKTRGKRDLNLGAQPLVTKVSSATGHDGSKSMLSSSSKIRGHMINLKKIMMPVLQDKMKTFVSKFIRENVILFYAGIDAVNLHFSNKAIHTGFIELGISFQSGAKEDQSKLTEVAGVILSDLREAITVFASESSCVITREILDDCNTPDDGIYFTCDNQTGDRRVISFKCGDDEQPFVEIRHIPYATTLFEKFGTFYMPLKFVQSDIKIGMSKYGAPDWKFREEALLEAITRGGLTFTGWTTYSLVRECFPSITMRKMKVRESVLAMIEANVARASNENSADTVAKIKKDLMSELDKYQDDTLLSNILTFEILFRRSVIMGFLPSQREFEEVIHNTYNDVIVKELRIANIRSA
jgi:hypothetical protein